MTTTHEHKLECSDIPGYYFCECGAQFRYIRDVQQFKLLEETTKGN